MTQERGKRALNRLQSMYALRAHVDKMYQETKEAKEEGGAIAWCMLDGGYGSPFLNAMGVKSVYPENYGTVLAAAGVAEPFLDRAGAEGFPEHLCGYARTCLGYAATMTELGEIPPGVPQGGMPKPVLLLSSGMACDARYKWFQALGRYLEAPVWTLELPNSGSRDSLKENVYEHNVDFLVKELREFVNFLERLLGRKMDWDKFEHGLDSTIEMNRVWYQINELRKARPGPMHSRDFWSSMSASALGTTDPEGITSLYRKMYEEVKYRVDNKIAGINREEKYRLTFVGLPPWHALGFFDQLAERGWNFVTEGAYHPTRPIDMSMVSDPIEKLVRYRYQSLAYRIETTFEPEEATEVKEEIKRQGFSNRLAARSVKEFQCDGAFFHPLLTCRATSASQPLQEFQLLRVWKVPGLTIPGDIVDRKLFDPVDALRKAEAFEETMDHYSRVRKEEGMEW